MIRVPAAETNGHYGFAEIVSEAGDATALHVHQNEDEHFVILEGTARIAYGDKIFDAAAGTSVTLTRGIPHAWTNPGNSPLRMLVITSPGGCDEILRIIARGGDIDLVALAASFDIQILGPMPSFDVPAPSKD